MDELKPCPFCGSPAKVHKDWTYDCYCSNDKCVLAGGDTWEDFTCTIDVWQSRPLEAALRAELEAAQKRIAELEKWIADNRDLWNMEYPISINYGTDNQIHHKYKSEKP